MDIVLTPIEARVLASLIEKEITTPEYYPLSLNALTNACNQKSNRDPEMALDDKTVAQTIETLRDKGLAWSVAQATARVPKYKHNLLGKLALSPPQVAVLCELMLRGPQTIGQLHAHAARLHAFASLQEVADAVQSLRQAEDVPLVVELPPGAGRREVRYAHRLSGDVPAESVPAKPAATPSPAGPGQDERLAAIESRLAPMQAAIEEIRGELADLKRKLGEG
jgi:uncharacterized protein YceH (UPF0502 family)